MKYSFKVDEIGFYELKQEFVSPIKDYLAATSGAFLVPSENWQNKLINLPSFCFSMAG